MSAAMTSSPSSSARQARCAARQTDARRRSPPPFRENDRWPRASTFRAGLVQLRSGRAIAPNMEMAEALIRRAAAGGAGLRADAREHLDHGARDRSASVARSIPRTSRRRFGSFGARQGLGILAACRLARHEASRPARSPTAPTVITPRGDDRRALRQAAYVRRRSSPAVKATGEFAQFRSGNYGGACRPALGTGSAEHLLRPSLPALYRGARDLPAPISSPCPPPSPSRPARRIGGCCCGARAIESRRLRPSAAMPKAGLR